MKYYLNPKLVFSVNFLWKAHFRHNTPWKTRYKMTDANKSSKKTFDTFRRTPFLHKSHKKKLIYIKCKLCQHLQLNI